VLEAARSAGIERVVYVSSTAVYGIPRKHPIEEDDPLIGIGPYGQSKVEAEAVCNEMRVIGLCVPILRAKTFLGTLDWAFSRSCTNGSTRVGGFRSWVLGATDTSSRRLKTSATPYGER
jgi:nucleoside-diphosphate-sugar epimerase